MFGTGVRLPPPPPKEKMLRIITLGISLLLLGASCPEAPDIKLTSIDGEYTSVSQYKGKVVVVSWWATWCKPCIQELKFLNKLAKKYSKDLVVVAVATDGPETQAAINSTIHSRQLKNLVVLLDPTGDTNPTGGLPYSIYIDRTGNQCSEQSGFVAGDMQKIEAKVKNLITKK